MADQKYSSGLLYKKIVDDKGNVSEEIPFLLKTLASLVIDDDGNNLQEDWENTIKKTPKDENVSQNIEGSLDIEKNLWVSDDITVSSGNVYIEDGGIQLNEIESHSGDPIIVNSDLVYQNPDFYSSETDGNTIVNKKYVDDKISTISTEVETDLSEVFNSKDKAITSTNDDWDTFITSGAFRVAITPNDSWGDASTNHSPGNYNEKLVRTGVLLVYSTNSKNAKRNIVQMYVPISVTGPTNRIVVRRGSQSNSSSGLNWSSWTHIVGDITKDEISDFNKPMYLDLADGKESVDLNDVKDLGLYSSVNQVFYDNCPTSVITSSDNKKSQSFSLMVLGSKAYGSNYTNSYVTQIIIDTWGGVGQNSMYIREYYGKEGWTEWFSFYTTKNKIKRSDITDFPSSMKNPNAQVITLNGGTTEGTDKFTYDGSETKTVNITPESIGIQNMKGATSSSSGTGGLVPVPDKGKQSSFLRGDGTWAVPTDNNTWRPVENVLTSSSTESSLSANQGKVLKGLIDKKADSDHTHTKSDITDFPTDMKGATTTKDGSSGLVPAPKTTNVKSVLKGDGTWGNAPCADKLTTGRYIDGVYFDASSNVSHFYEASSENEEINETNSGVDYIIRQITVPGFTTSSGNRIYVKFTDLSKTLNKLGNRTNKRLIRLKIEDSVNDREISATNGIGILVPEVSSNNNLINNHTLTLDEVKEDLIYELMYMNNIFKVINYHISDKQPRVERYVIAAHDTPAVLRENADYVCIGYNDQEIINKLIGNDSGNLGKFIEIRLLDGHYNFSGSVNEIKPSCRIVGSGPDTVISSTSIKSKSIKSSSATGTNFVTYDFEKKSVTFNIGSNYVVSFEEPSIVRIFESIDSKNNKCGCILIGVDSLKPIINGERSVIESSYVYATFDYNSIPTDISDGLNNVELTYFDFREITSINFLPFFELFDDLKDNGSKRTLNNITLENFTLSGECCKYYDESAKTYYNIIYANVYNSNYMNYFVPLSDDYIKSNIGDWERNDPYISSIYDYDTNSSGLVGEINGAKIAVNDLDINKVLFKIPKYIMNTNVISFDNEDRIVSNVNIKDSSFVRDYSNFKDSSAFYKELIPDYDDILINGKISYLYDNKTYVEYSSVNIKNCKAYNLIRTNKDNTNNNLYYDQLLIGPLSIKDVKKSPYLSIDSDMIYKLYDGDGKEYNKLSNTIINSEVLQENGINISDIYKKNCGGIVVASSDSLKRYQQGADLIIESGEDTELALSTYLYKLFKDETGKIIVATDDENTKVYCDCSGLNVTIMPGTYTFIDERKTSPHYSGLFVNSYISCTVSVDGKTYGQYITFKNITFEGFGESVIFKIGSKDGAEQYRGFTLIETHDGFAETPLNIHFKSITFRKNEIYYEGTTTTTDPTSLFRFSNVSHLFFTDCVFEINPTNHPGDPNGFTENHSYSMFNFAKSSINIRFNNCIMYSGKKVRHLNTTTTTETTTETSREITTSDRTNDTGNVYFANYFMFDFINCDGYPVSIMMTGLMCEFDVSLVFPVEETKNMKCVSISSVWGSNIYEYKAGTNNNAIVTRKEQQDCNYFVIKNS